MRKVIVVVIIVLIIIRVIVIEIVIASLQNCLLACVQARITSATSVRHLRQNRGPCTYIYYGR